MRRFLPLLLLAFACLPVARAATEATDAPYIEFMQKSGLWAQLADMESEVLAGVRKSPGFDEERMQPLLRRVSEVYSADRLRFAVVASLRETLKPGDARVLLHWYGTALGQRIVAAEEEASKPDHIATRANDAAKALAALKPARKAHLLRLMKASDSVEAAVTISIDSLLGMSRGAAMAAGKPMESTDAAKARIEMSRAQIAGALQPMLLGLSAITYQHFTDRELDQYSAVLESRSGRTTTKAVNAALDKALTDAAAKLGRGIAEDARPAGAEEVKA